jgi:hypothetical protein
MACSLVTELATSGGVPEIVGVLIDAYSTSRSIDGDLWAARALDDVVCDIGVFCRARNRCNASCSLKIERARKLDCVIVRLLCRLTLLVCRAAEKRAGRSPARTAHIFEVDRTLPTDLEIDECTGRIKLEPCLTQSDSHAAPGSRELRAAVLASLRHHIAVDRNGQNARALVHLLVSRCRRTLRDYNAMHAALLDDGESRDGESRDGESRDGESREGESDVSESREGESREGESREGESDVSESREGESREGESDVSSAFLPLTFEGLVDRAQVGRAYEPALLSRDASRATASPLQYSVLQSNSGRNSDVVWAIWRVLRDVGSADPAASEFVTRMASLYAFRWAPSRRDRRLNVILYASAVAMRGRVRCEEPDEDFIELIDIAEARAENTFSHLIEDGVKN